MRKILVLIDDFFPDVSANAVCVSQLINEFVNNQGFTVDLITFSSESNNKSIDSINHCNVYKVFNFQKKLNKVLSAKSNPIIYIVFKSLQKISSLLIWPSSNFFSKNNYLYQANKLISQNNYSFIILSSGDFLIQEIGLHLNISNERIYSLLLDPPLSINPRFNNFHKFIYYRLLNRIYTRFCRIFTLDNYFINKYPHKQKIINLPNLNLNLYHTYSPLSTSELVFFYSGSLDIKERNPDLIIRLINSLVKKFTVSFDLYSWGLRKSEINHISKISKFRLRYNDPVDILDLHEKFKLVDVFISIGNKSPILFPSKIIEYVSTGRAIIHFCQNPKDPTVKILNNYNNSLILYTKDPENINLQKTIDFLDKKLVQEKISSIKVAFETYSPKFVADTIIKAINL